MKPPIPMEKIGRTVIPVVEKYTELDLILQQASRLTPKQMTQQAMQMNAWAVSLGASIAQQSATQTVEPWTQPRREQIR